MLKQSISFTYTHITPYPYPQSLLGCSLLQMLELAVAEIHNQDEHVWNMKQDEHNQPILLDRLSSSVPHFDPISLWDWVLEAYVVGRHQLDNLLSFSISRTLLISFVASLDNIN